MPLAQTPTSIISDPSAYMTAVHSFAGVGKTSFGVQIEGHYFLQTEIGTEGVEPYGDPIFDWKGFIAKGKELIDAKKSNFERQRKVTTLVVDTVENLFEYAGIEVCATQRFVEKGVAQKFDKIDDVPYGKGYKAACQLMLRNLEQLRLHGFGMLLLSHTKERPVTWAGKDWQHHGFNLPPSAATAVENACGAIGNFVIEEVTKKNEAGDIVNVETGRFQYWQPTFLRLAKHRLENFPEKLSLPIHEGWKVYCDAFAETVAKIKERKRQ